MAVYLIVLPDDPGESTLPSETIKRTFPDNMSLIEGRLWVVQTDLETCGRVSEKLDLGNPPNEYTGLVFRITERFGYHYTSFWDGLRAMESKAP